MIEISLFVEDFGQEEFLSALIERLAREEQVVVMVRRRSVRGGRGRALAELAQYVRDIGRSREALPDFLVVVSDANCKGNVARRKEVEHAAAGLEQSHPGLLVLAVPDPHVERWMLVDSRAFKAVFGRGCDAPDAKCAKDRYKQVLLDAIRAAGIVPPLGGMEFARDIVDHLDLERADNLDGSLGQAVAALRNRFRNSRERL
ncbi:MAG: opine dehydrogenase [Acidobacteriota bacterium]|jgi:hypothetical protein|nr:opine dehydrogenase [Acidobacteriota bacterium]